ncbi:RTC4 [Candida theae]|uniref:Restriction of telomere capping protein 4 n=1 Tax=Candida theae TaxID=1198502 RepID=A0AAD5BEF1_9ASCO|nr:RTC4 [Candida theae]KAI5957776.1 RTC4 [Candida theae]
MNKDYGSLNTHAKPKPTPRAKPIRPANFETGFVPYRNSKPHDNPHMNSVPSIFSPEKSSDQTNKKYSRPKNKGSPKRRPVYVHNDKNSDQNGSNFRDVSAFPHSLDSTKLNPAVDDDDDKEFGIINVNRASPSPAKKEKKKRKQFDFGEVEGLVDIRADAKQFRERKMARTSEHVTEIEPPNSLSTFESAKYGSRSDVLQKYKSKGIPPPIKTRSELIRRAQKHFGCIEPILKGKETPSVYYERAKEQQRSSPHETMTAKEQTKIDWESFYGGYYGFQRQSIIGKEITKACKLALNRCRMNPAISYWTIPSFAIHVLANEVIIRLIMEDLKLDYDDAERFCEKSTDYGIVIADKVEIENDM